MKYGIRRLFKRKKLRDICREKYGDEFVKEYDKLCAGEAIGGYEYTMAFCNAVERARKEAGYGEKRKLRWARR